LIALIEYVSSNKIGNLNEIQEDQVVTEFYLCIDPKFMDEF